MIVDGHFHSMAILQALLALITKSAGKILNAIFGWAVRALFGRASAREITFLSAMVGAAAAWPLLLVGVVAPKLAALMLAFVPLPHWVPSWVVRLVWLGLVVAVPLIVGITIAAKAPPQTPPRSVFRRLLSGFPITIGLALAFFIMFVTVPVMRFAALVRGHKSADIPLITENAAYHAMAAVAVTVLRAHGFDLTAAKPGWWVSAPTRVLRFFGGDSFNGFVPKELEHFEARDLAVSFYPSGVLLRGKGQRLTWAHGLIAEATAAGDGLQTSDPKAQDLEKQIRRVRRTYDNEPEAHLHAEGLQKRIGEMTRELGSLDVEFDDWQVIYRQLLQLERAIHGQRQLLDGKSTNTPDQAPSTATRVGVERDASPTAEALSTVDLVKEIAGQVAHLATKQIELAKVELKADLKSEAATVGGLGIAAVCSIATVNLLLMTCDPGAGSAHGGVGRGPARQRWHLRAGRHYRARGLEQARPSAPGADAPYGTRRCPVVKGAIGVNNSDGRGVRGTSATAHFAVGSDRRG
jgi:hypothetical protein